MIVVDNIMDYNYKIQEKEAPEEQDKKVSTSYLQKVFNTYTFTQEDKDRETDKNNRQALKGPVLKKPAFLVNDMENTFIDLKKSFEYVGDNSTFQKRITTILVIQWIAFSYMVNSMAYLFRSPTFKCRLPLTDITYICDHKTACFNMKHDLAEIIFENNLYLNYNQVSITQQFDLICENQGWAPFAQSMFFLGGFCSGYLFSYISAKIGRRSILLIILFLSITSILICALAPNFQIFVIGYFLTGFCLFGYETNVYIYIGEISAIRFRTISINMLTMVWAGAPIFLPFLTFIPSWRYVFIAFAGLLLMSFPLVYLCFLESPRFLVSKGCYKQARSIFRDISVTNRRPPYDFRLFEQIDYQNKQYLHYGTSAEIRNLNANNLQGEQIKKKKAYSFLDLFKFESLKKITIVLMYWWMFRFFMYFGLNLALQSILRSGLFLTMAIAFAAVVQVIGSFGITLMTTIIYKKYKLNIMKACLFLVTMSCVLMWFLKIENDCKGGANIENYRLCYQLILILILVIIIKFFNTVFFSGLIGYHSEVYPTPVRSIGCGFTMTFGRLGTIIVPFYINYMKVGYPEKNSLCFMAPFGIIAYILCYIMPHTEDEGMKQSIQEEKIEYFETQMINMPLIQKQK